MMLQRLDVVIFGASGCTGRYCIKYVQKLLKENNYTWGIAGRSEKKLKQTLEDCQRETIEDLSNIPIIVADATNYSSLREMTVRARVLINCCGPYQLYGEKVVRSCTETGTHQVDVAGETKYIEHLQLKYHDLAEEKAVYIVNACGFDCISGDMGILYTAQQFEGVLNSVEVYVELRFPNHAAGSMLNYATWESLLHSFSTVNELRELRRTSNLIPLPKFLPKLQLKKNVHKCDVTNTWNVPLLSADRSVVLRTQRYLFENKKVRPIQSQFYLGIKSQFWLYIFLLYNSIFQFLVKYSFGCKLLMKYPKLFSMGIFSNEMPKRVVTKFSEFTLTFVGKGWEDPGKLDENLLNKKIVCRISGYDPAYGFTANAATLCAITILEESEKLPKRGGVYTPGAAFYDTSLLTKLQKYAEFEVISNNYV